MVGEPGDAEVTNAIMSSVAITSDIFTGRTLDPGITSVQVGFVCVSGDTGVTNTDVSSVTMSGDVLARLTNRPVHT